MREKMGLYRGKQKVDGKWVEGSYLHLNLGRDFICDGTVWIGTLEPCKVEVIPETVSQYTGLTDKNGTKIFEGDIVRVFGNQQVEDWKNVDYNALIAFIDGGFCAIDGTVEEHGFRRYGLCRMDYDLEVIGTIHDNPDLLAKG